jgi:hypothetical protein
MLTRLEQLPEATECIFLGNSLVEAGCDVESFRQGWADGAHGHKISAANLALGATSPVEHYLILKQALQRPIRLKWLIYGFFDDQLNAAPQGKWSELVGNRAFSYYFPNEAAAFYAPGSRFKKWELAITAHVPMLAERSSLWGKVELLRRSIEEIGMPRQKVNRFGRVEDFTSLEASDVDSFTQRCNAIVNRGQDFSAPIQQIVGLARDHGARVILVEMPLPSRHRQVFYSTPAWSNLRARLQSLATENEVVYIPASDWVKDDQKFEDATHLNEDGARLFSSQLASAISRLQSWPTPSASPAQRF